MLNHKNVYFGGVMKVCVEKPKSVKLMQRIIDHSKIYQYEIECFVLTASEWDELTDWGGNILVTQFTDKLGEFEGVKVRVADAQR